MLHRIPIWAATLLLTVPAHAGTDFDDGPDRPPRLPRIVDLWPLPGAPPTKEAVRGAIVAVEPWSRESGSARNLDQDDGSGGDTADPRRCAGGRMTAPRSA